MIVVGAKLVGTFKVSVASAEEYNVDEGGDSSSAECERYLDGSFFEVSTCLCPSSEQYTTEGTARDALTYLTKNNINVKI